jgi:putative spermidine/putrescine transport system permease protein
MARLTAGPRAGINARRRTRITVFRAVVVGATGLLFLLPLYAMAEFTTRGIGPNAPRSLAAWRAITSYPDLGHAVVVSLELALLTSVAMLLLVVPTMIWVRLRLPRLLRTIEFLCLLPLTIPAIVLVVGLAPVYLWVTYAFGNSPLTLVFAYVVLTLPYAYRAVDAGLMALDLKTLSEAARSLGASWPTILLRVLAPNLSGALLNASLLSVSLVIGEFTVASLLGFQNLQTEIFTLGRVDAAVSVSLALGSLMFSFILLVALSFLGGHRRSRSIEKS